MFGHFTTFCMKGLMNCYRRNSNRLNIREERHVKKQYLENVAELPK